MNILAFNYEDKALPEVLANTHHEDGPAKVQDLNGNLMGEMTVIKTNDDNRVVIYTGSISVSELNRLDDSPAYRKWYHKELDLNLEQIIEMTAGCEQVNYNRISLISNKF